MKMPDWLKHTVGGGVFIGVVGYLADRYLKKNTKLNEQQKKIAFGTAIGAAGGGTLGYYVGEKVIDGRIPDCEKKKMIGALVGAAAGGGAGYLISRVSGAPAKCYGEQPVLDADYEVVSAENNSQGIEEKLEGGN